MNFTPDAALAAQSNDELIPLLAGRTQWPTWQLLHTLGLRGREIIPAVIHGLGSEQPQIRRWCAELLDHNADDSCIAPLAALMDDPIAHVRWQAVHSLGCQRCKGAPLNVQKVIAARMLKLAFADPSARVRAGALQALQLDVELKTPETLAKLRSECERINIHTPSKRERALQRALVQALGPG